MELYPAKFDWADNDCILLQDAGAQDLVSGLPPQLCEVYVGQRYCAPVTVIVTIIERNVAPLKTMLEAQQFGADLSSTVRAIVEYAEAHPDPDGEYCFVFAEP